MNWVIVGDIILIFFYAIKNSYSDCNIGLGMISGGIRDPQITASSSYSMWTQPSAGRLWNNMRLHESTLGGWCAMEEDDDPYLQIDLGKQKVITAVATQGLNNPQGNWVERYSLNYSCDGINWKTYQSFAKDEVLKGNTDGDTVVSNKLDEAIVAREIRIKALQWNMYGMVCMRVEIYGCDTDKDGRFEDCSTVAGMENRQITDRQVTASSFASGHHPSRGRLNNEIQHVNGTVLLGSWCAATQDTSQYIQVDLAASRNISGVATQGSVMGTWVAEYTLNYSMDGLHWNTYCNQTDGKIKILQGNVDTLTVYKNMLDRRINARYIRINPRAWTPTGQICMRVEIYLCHNYQGCPTPNRIQSTSTTMTSQQITSAAQDLTKPTKINTLSPGSKSVVNNAWELYSSGDKNRVRSTLWKATVVGWYISWNLHL